MAIQGPQGFYPNAAAIRASEADRARAVEILAAAFAEGRLDGTEHRSRVDSALRATAYHELSELTADLPAAMPPVPPGYAMQPYAMGPYGMYPAYAYPRSAPVDGCSVAALVCALVTPVLWFLFGLPAVAAVICGHIALARAPRYSPGSRGMAIAGLVIGYAALAIGALFITMIIAAAVQ
ncbi:MAG TPA: DUF1707 and DUF4190 domain-containing protein [Streptosporangiaceae bacterium]